MVTASEPLSVSVASFEDYSSIESAWWRLLTDQQNFDPRGSVEELGNQVNTERVRRFIESRIRQGRMLVAKQQEELLGI